MSQMGRKKNLYYIKSTQDMDDHLPKRVSYWSDIKPFDHLKMPDYQRERIKNRIKQELNDGRLDKGWDTEGKRNGGSTPTEICQVLVEDDEEDDPDLPLIYSKYFIIRALGEELERGYTQTADDPTKRPRIGLEQNVNFHRGEVRFWDKFYQPDFDKMEEVFGSLGGAYNIAYIIKEVIENLIKYSLQY